MPKILITIDWFLPGTASGGPVRSYANLIDHLNKDHEFYIITRNTDFGSDEPYENIIANTWNKFNDYTSVYYISKEELNQTNLKTIISQIDYDYAYINGIYSWWFSILPIKLLKRQNKPIIVSARGMLNPQAFSIKGSKKRLFLKLAKIIGMYNTITFHATNTEEAGYVKAILGEQTTVKVAPNLARKIKNTSISTAYKETPVRFVNIARVAVEKGTLVMLNALKNIKTPLILDLFGPIYDDAYWKKCQQVINQLSPEIKVTYKGVLHSNDVPEKLKEYNFFILLSEGENFGHAIIEAFSVGLPVIISNQTPWKDLKVKEIGWDIDTSIVSNVQEVLKEAIEMDNESYKLWCDNAFQFAKNFMEDPKLIEKNKALFLKVRNNI